MKRKTKKTSFLPFVLLGLVVLGIVYYFFFSSFSRKSEVAYVYVDADVYGQPEKLLNKFNRDSEGRICKVVGAMFDTNYTWEGKRIVKYVRGIESGLRTREYHYGAKGLIEYATNTTEYETYEDDDPTEVTRVKEVYEYKKFDKYGNWTERTVKGVTSDACDAFRNGYLGEVHTSAECVVQDNSYCILLAVVTDCLRYVNHSFV